MLGAALSDQLIGICFIVIGALWILGQVRNLFRKRVFPPGHCDWCGYDLTGNTSGTCPECGKPLGWYIAKGGRARQCDGTQHRGRI